MKFRVQNTPKLGVYIFFLLFVFFLLFTFSQEIEGQVKTETIARYDEIILEMAQKFNIESSLIHSIIRAESNYNTHAISPKGAMGLMQLMPETAKMYGVMDLFNARENIEAGVRYLKNLMSFYNRKLDLVLAAYNAGPDAVEKHNGIPPYPETRNYIRRVLTAYNSSSIRTRSPVYKFYDSSGKVVLTNMPYSYHMTKRKEKADKDS